MKLFHLYPEGGPAPPMTSSICVLHLGISLGVDLIDVRWVEYIPVQDLE